MDHFYITLPSNNSFQFYGKQSMSNYKSKLAKPIHLNVDQWEVGLAEIHYPVSWHNVRNGTFKVRKLVKNEWAFIEGSVPDNRYQSVDHLLIVLHQKLAEILGDQKSNIALSELDTRHVKLYMADSHILYLSSSLTTALGFGGECTIGKQPNGEYTEFSIFGGESETCDFKLKNNSIHSTYVADVNRGMKTFFVHSDIVESQLVGDQYVPLLRTISVKGKNGEMITKSFTNIHYMRIQRSTFQEIELHITSDTGHNIPFQDGRVIVKLHFKRK